MLLGNIKYLISNKPALGSFFLRQNLMFPSPLFLLAHITLSCNRQCHWCYQKEKGFYPSSGAPMSVAAFAKILSGFRYFKPHIHLYGGEPLSHPEFLSFLDYCKIYGYQPTLTTNGDYLDKYGDSLIKSKLEQLNISINGLFDCEGNINSEFANKITAFIRINDGRKTVNLNFVIGPDSYKYMGEAVAFFNSNFKPGQVACFVFQHLSWKPEAPGQKTGLDLAKIASALPRGKKLYKKFKILSLPDIKLMDLGKYYCSEHSFRNQCCVPWFGLNIYPDLSVTPGGGVLGCNFPLGNLNRDSLIEIWRGKNLMDFRLRLIQEGLPRICNRCCHKFYY